jgi:hypothetical protein
MRNAPVLAAVAIGAVAVISGCGQQHPETSAPSATAQSSATAHNGAGAASACRGTPLQSVVFISNSDNHRSLCVQRSTAVLVYLLGTATSRWAAIHVSSAVLQPLAHGYRGRMRGVTGASFLAVRSGTAAITSIRSVCGPAATPGNGASARGTLRCGAMLAFRVTVTVT